MYEISVSETSITLFQLVPTNGKQSSARDFWNLAGIQNPKYSSLFMIIMYIHHENFILMPMYIKSNTNIH